VAGLHTLLLCSQLLLLPVLLLLMQQLGSRCLLCKGLMLMQLPQMPWQLQWPLLLQQLQLHRPRRLSGLQQRQQQQLQQRQRSRLP
jgi:hypothetical protein